MFSPPRTVIFFGRSPVWPPYCRLYSARIASCGFLYISTHCSYFPPLFGASCVLMAMTVPSILPSPGNPPCCRSSSMYTAPVCIPENNFIRFSWDSNPMNIPQYVQSGQILYTLWHGHDDVIKWKHLSRYWPFVRGIHQSPVYSPHKGQWRGALMFSLICVWINGSVKQSWSWWFETPSSSLWRHSYGYRDPTRGHLEKMSHPCVARARSAKQSCPWKVFVREGHVGRTGRGGLHEERMRCGRK